MRIDKDKLPGYAITAFGLLPIMPNGLTGILPLFLIFAALVFFLNQRDREVFPEHGPRLRTIFVNSSLFLVYLFSLFYTEDLGYGLRKLGPAAWIPLFPIAFYGLLGRFRAGKSSIHGMFRLMTLSTALYLVFFLLYAFAVRDWVAVAEISTANQLRGILLEIPHFNKHPIYLSLFIGVSVLYVFHAITFQKSITRLQRSVMIVALIFLILFLFLIQSKGALIYLILSIPALWILQGSKQMVRFLVLAVLIAVSGVIVIAKTSSQNRFSELWNPKTYSDSSINPYNSSQIRLAIWKTSAAAIQRSPIWGYGLGDVQNELDEGYRERFPILLEKQYNSHNQYMGVWLSAGIAGIFFLLLLFFDSMRKLLKSPSESGNFASLSFAILVFFALNFLTENVIERQLGSLLFFFLLNLLGSVVSRGENPVSPQNEWLSGQIRKNNSQM